MGSRERPYPLDALLEEAELSEYLDPLQRELHLSHAGHLRHTTSEDLSGLGMSRPEIRRLWAVHRRRCPAGLFGRLRQRVLGRSDSVPLCSAVTSVAGSPAGSRGPSLEPSPSESHHIIPLNAITLCKNLGGGEFGVVYQGVWNGGGVGGQQMPVAVKVLEQEKLQASPMDFLHEAAVMHTLRHPAIARLFGVVLDVKSIMLVSELAPFRSLLECLREPTLVPSFPVLRLCDYAVQVAEGMEFLAQERFIHRDLAARNILVFADRVKISDFGLSRALGIGEEYYRTEYKSDLRLPIAWCAPECVQFLRFTTASDIWAFGVTLWEMFSYGIQPWLGLNGHQIMQEPRFERLERPDACPRDMYNQILVPCWSHDPADRPSFPQLQSLLQDLRPEQVEVIKGCEDGVPDHLQLGSGDLITVLDKTPSSYPDGYYWKGVLPSGRTGLFQPGNTVAHLSSDFPASSLRMALHGDKQIMNTGFFPQPQDQNRPKLPERSSSFKWPLGKKETKKKGQVGFLSARGLEKKGSATPLISGPQGDFRHLGHLDTSGVYFGVLPAQLKNAVPRRRVPEKTETMGSMMTESAMPELMGSEETEAGYIPHDNRHASTSSETASLIHRHSDIDTHLAIDLQLTTHRDTRKKTGFWGGGSLLDEVFSALDSGPPDLDVFAQNAPFPNSAKDENSECESGKKTPPPKAKKPEAVVRPVNLLESQLLRQVTNTAQRLNDKALSKTEAIERASAERREKEEMADLQVALSLSRTSDSTDSGPSSKEEKSGSSESGRKEYAAIIRPSSFKKKLANLKLHRSGSSDSGGSGDSGRRCWGDQLATGPRNRGFSPGAEDAYRSLVHAPNTQQLSDPEDPRPSPPPPPPSVPPPEDDSPNPLRLLRSDAAGIARSFKPKPRFDLSLHPPVPPPVPPKPKNRAHLKPPTEVESYVSPLRACIPKPNATASEEPQDSAPLASEEEVDKEVQDGTQEEIDESEKSEPPNRDPLDFTLETVDKYELLDFVLAAFNDEKSPESGKSCPAGKLSYADIQFQNGNLPPAVSEAGKSSFYASRTSSLLAKITTIVILLSTLILAAVFYFKNQYILLFRPW